MEFMTRRIAYLMEEQENGFSLLNTRNLDVKAIRALEEPQKTKISNPYDGVLPLDLRKYPSVITLNCTIHAYLASGQLITLHCQSHAEQTL
jgi:hypothetical protein